MEPLFSMFATFYVSTESFIRSSADFQILTIDEKCSLFQRNLHGVLHLCATLILQLSGMFECSAKENLILTAYGHDIFLETKRIALQLDYDLTIIKLFLFIRIVIRLIDKEVWRMIDFYMEHIVYSVAKMCMLKLYGNI